MKEFNVNAASLIISFVDDEGEEIEWEIDSLPIPNPFADTACDSENSEEYISEDEKYRANIYVNNNEGNIELFNNETEEEIDDFEVKEIFDTKDLEYGEEDE